MKTWFVFILFISFSFFTHASELKKKMWNDFTGTLGYSHIKMSLYILTNGGVVGTYFNTKTEKEIDLDGFVKKDSIYLTEFTGDTTFGYFSGVITSDFMNKIEGFWTDISKKKLRNFSVELSTMCYGTKENRYSENIYGTKQEIETFTKELKEAVLTKNRDWLTNNISFPITVTVGQNRLVTIKDKNDFSIYFDKILSDSFVEKIKKSTTINLFSKEEGVVFGDCQEIIINNTSNSSKNKYKLCIIAVNN